MLRLLIGHIVIIIINIFYNLRIFSAYLNFILMSTQTASCDAAECILILMSQSATKSIQVISMGLEIKKDAGFNDKLVTFLYALEVQYMVENGLEEELQEAQEAYDIPEERAAEIIDACCQRYISQLLNLALRDAKKYNEAGAFEYTSQIMKYAQYISGAVDADGNVFREEDKTRMLSFYEARLLEDVPSADEEGIARVSEGIAKLRSLVNLTESYVAPIDGIDGLLGKLSGMQTVGEDGKKWAWGS